MEVFNGIVTFLVLFWVFQVWLILWLFDYPARFMTAAQARKNTKRANKVKKKLNSLLEGVKIASRNGHSQYLSTLPSSKYSVEEMELVKGELWLKGFEVQIDQYQSTGDIVFIEVKW